MSLQYISIPIDVPKSFDEVTPYAVQCLRSKVKRAKARVLFVLDHIPSEDLKSGMLLGGGTGATLSRVLKYASSNFSCTKDKFEELDFLFVNWNCWKSYNMSEDRRAESASLFADRVGGLIDEYAADYVVLCGPEPFQYMMPKQWDLCKGKPTGWLGNSMPLKSPEGREVRCIYNMSLSTLLNPKTIKDTSYLLGYYARNLLPIFCGGKMPFKIAPVKTGKKRNFKIHRVDKIAQFRAMMKKLRSAKYVAVDTETDGLYRVNVNLLTLQFSICDDESYVLPVMHNDAKWTEEELEEILDTLKDFFEFDNKNKLHIYTNAKFDLNILRNCVGVRYFKNNVWDIIAGDFALDENMKVLRSITGEGYYRLANLSMQYGCTAYLTANFGKENRSMIKDVPLSEDVLEYAALDTIIPFRIFHKQLQRGRAMGYAKYQSIVSEQISDQIHTFSTLEYTGAATDVDYLFRLALPDSPINKLLYSTVDEFKATEEVQRADRRLKKRSNIPLEGLFGKIKDRLFKFNQREHIQTLFFDVMGLEPITVSETKFRANGKPEAKVDKVFQEKHKNNPVVAMYTSVSKLLKLRNAYVKSLIKMFGEDVDFNTTRRLRPTYNFAEIVTGRTSANSP